MKVSTLSVGDELVCGQVTDTNAGTIAEALLTHGLRVQRHVTVGDSEPDIIEALLELSRNSDAVIVTGGLGPTADDLTARAAARATGPMSPYSFTALLSATPTPRVRFWMFRSLLTAATTGCHSASSFCHSA